jgi:hypothetical protein
MNRTTRRRSRSQINSDIARFAEINRWKEQTIEERMEHARKTSASPAELKAYRQGLADGAREMIATLRMHGLI